MTTVNGTGGPEPDGTATAPTVDDDGGPQAAGVPTGAAAVPAHRPAGIPGASAAGGDRGDGTAAGETDETVGEVGEVSRLLLLALLSSAFLMVMLDSTIVAVALPSMQADVGLSDAARQWAVTAYTLCFGGLLLLGGHLGDLFGRKRALMVGVASFALASALAGAATDAAMLIGGRAIQGMSAALIAPTTLSLVSTVFSEARERARAFAVYAATGMSGGAVGLILGGLLTSSLDWRWCMYVNLPVAVAVLIAGASLLPDRTGEAVTRLDLPSAVLGTGGVAALIYALGEAGAEGWDSGRVVACLVASAVVLTAFVVVQAKVPHPLLPLRVLTNRNSGVAYLAMAMSAFCTYGLLLGMTYQFQEVMGYSPLRTGLAFLAYVVTAVVYTTQVARRLALRIAPGRLIAAGMATYVVALLLLMRVDASASYATEILPVLLLFGIGVGTVTVPIMSTVAAQNAPGDAGVVSAMVSSSQQVGGSIGAALLNSVSVSAAAAYLDDHPGGRAAEVAAAAHGLVAASGWSAVVAAVGALVALVAINARVNRPA